MDLSFLGQENFDEVIDLLIDRLLDMIKHHTSETAFHAIAEQIVLALGAFSITSFSHVKEESIRQILVKTSAMKSLEVNISVGKALTLVAAGPFSACAPRSTLEKRNSAVSKDVLAKIKDHVKFILSECSTSNQAAVRRAAGVYYVLFLKLLRGMEDLLPDIQNAFIDLLSEGNDITQALASDGLNLCYELGSDELKKDLVRTLIETLSTGRKSQVNAFLGHKFASF